MNYRHLNSISWWFLPQPDHGSRGEKVTKKPPQGELEIPMSSQPEAGCSARPRGFLHARVGSHEITCGLESPHTTEILFAEVFPPRPKTRSLPALRATHTSATGENQP